MKRINSTKRTIVQLRNLKVEIELQRAAGIQLVRVFTWIQNKYD